MLRVYRVVGETHETKLACNVCGQERLRAIDAHEHLYEAHRVDWAEARRQIGRAHEVFYGPVPRSGEPVTEYEARRSAWEAAQLATQEANQ